MNAVSMYPSIPISLPSGSRKFAMYCKREISPNETFAKIQITIPAGAATLIALPNTNKVRSKMERTNILPNCGFLYGGSSKLKEDGTPFKSVFDKSLEITNVIHIPINTTISTHKVEIIELLKPVNNDPINILEIVIKIGNLPVTWHKIVCNNCY